MRTMLIVLGLLLSFASPSHAQVYPAGSFRIDGIPVACGNVVTVVNNSINDIAQSDLKGHIYISALRLNGVPTVLKLWAYAHECGHYQEGANETAADCWAIRTGRQEGWFRASDFPELEEAFANNAGDLSHPPGSARVENMKNCFGTSKGKQSDDNDESSGEFCTAVHQILNESPSHFRDLRARRIDGERWISSVTVPDAASCIVVIGSTYPHLQCSFVNGTKAEIATKVAACLDRSKWTLHTSEGYFETNEDHVQDQTEIDVHTSTRNADVILAFRPPQ